MSVFKCEKCGATKEGRCKPKACPECGAKESMAKSECETAPKKSGCGCCCK